MALGCALLRGATTPSSGPATIVINEVRLEAADGQPAWVELYNHGDAPVDVRAWTLGSNVYSQLVSLPGMSLPPGASLVVRFGSGGDDLDASDGSATFHVPGEDTPFEGDAGSVALYRCAPSPACLVDYVAYEFSGELVESDPHRHAVSAGKWPSEARIDLGLFAEPGATLGRDAAGTDTDTPTDFAGLGGAAALGPTPGAPNAGAPDVGACVDAPADQRLDCRMRMIDGIETDLLAGTGDRSAIEARLGAGVRDLYTMLRQGTPIGVANRERLLQWLVWQARRDGRVGPRERADLQARASELGLDGQRFELFLRGCRAPQLTSCENGCPGGSCCFDSPRPPGAIACTTICERGTAWCPAAADPAPDASPVPAHE